MTHAADVNIFHSNVTLMSQAVAKGTASFEELAERSQALHDRDLNAALHTAQQAFAIARKSGDAGQIAMGHYIVGRAYLSLSDYEPALRELLKARDGFEHTNNQRFLARSLYCLGNIYSGESEFEQAALVLNQAVQLAVGLGNPVLQALALQGLGVLAFNKGDNEEALKHYFTIIGLIEGTDNAELMGSTFVSIALVYNHSGLPLKALEHMESAEQAMLSTGNLLHLASLYCNRALTFSNMGYRNQALETYLQSRALFHRLGNTKGYLVSLLGIGRLMMENGELKRAEKIFLECKESAAASEQTFACLAATTYLGELHLKRAELAEAFNYLQECRQAVTAYPNSECLSHIHRLQVAYYTASAGDATGKQQFKEALGFYRQCDYAVGEVEMRSIYAATLCENGNFEDGIREYQRALKLAETSMCQGLSADIHFRMHELNRKAGKHKAAARHLEQAYRVREQIASEERAIISARASLADAGKDSEQQSSAAPPTDPFSVKESSYAHLCRSCPQLTPMELRIAIMIVHNLRSKEMAESLHISVRTIEGHRRAIRKKLALQPEQSIQAALAVIIQASKSENT